MKNQISRVPFSLLDDFTIYCFRLKQQDLTQEEIASILGKDRCTIIYHFRRYADKSKFSKSFMRKINEFDEIEFLKQYKKTGRLNIFYKSIAELPKKLQ